MYGDEAPKEYDRGWVCDNLGAKWVYSEFEYDEEPQHIHLMLTSAWSVPIQLLEKLGKILTDIKEDCYICGTYEDESMDPCGAFIYAKDYDDIEDYDGFQVKDSQLLDWALLELLLETQASLEW